MKHNKIKCRTDTITLPLLIPDGACLKEDLLDINFFTFNYLWKHLRLVIIDFTTPGENGLKTETSVDKLEIGNF